MDENQGHYLKMVITQSIYKRKLYMETPTSSPPKKCRCLLSIRQRRNTFDTIFWVVYIKSTPGHQPQRLTQRVLEAQSPRDYTRAGSRAPGAAHRYITDT